MIKVVLPAALRRLAKLDGNVEIEMDPPFTQRNLLSALEQKYPMLRGTTRDQQSQKRRAYVRFYACGEDLSDESPDAELPPAVVAGKEPYLIVGAMSGG